MNLKVSVLESSHPRYKHEVHYPDGDKRKVKYFKILSGVDGADKWAKDKRKDLAALGAKNEAVTSAELRAIHTFREELIKLPSEAQDYTLEDAVKLFIKSIQSRHKSISCKDVAASYVDTLRAEQKSKRHIDTTISRLKKFNADYGDWLACDMTTEVLSDFLTTLKSTPKKRGKGKKRESAKALGTKSKNNYRLTLSGMFSHAVKLKASKENPVEDAIRFKVVKSEVGVLEPQELAMLLNASDDKTRAGIAISFLAGLRRSEITTLDWSNVDLEEDFIKVTAHTAKGDLRRIVTISPNLKLWLAPLHKNRGLVMESPDKWRKGLDRARAAAKIVVWPQNAARHSFASYHLAMHEDAGKTAFQLGHKGSVATLHSNYKAVVSQKKAKTYWSIAPASEENITNIKTA